MNLPENIWDSPEIKTRLEQEAEFSEGWGKKLYWVMVPEGNTGKGLVVKKNFTPNLIDIEPHPQQRQFAENLQSLLQRELHYDGLWIVGWTNPPATGSSLHVAGDNVWSRLFMIWLDEDADMHFTVESELPVIEILNHGEPHYVMKAEEAMEKWREEYGKKAMKDDFGISESQQTKKTLISLNS